MSGLLQQWSRLLLIGETRSIHTCTALGAARKGTRARKNAKRKASKKEEIVKAFIPYERKLLLEKVGTISPRTDDSGRPIAIDDVYFSGYHKLKTYSIMEAVEMHKETADPTQYNKPNGSIIANIELSMSTDKKGKYLSGFSNILTLPFPYPIKHRRTVLALCKDEEMVEEMKLLNVDLAVGPEFLSLVQKGELDFKLYDFIVAHNSLLPNLVTFRSTLKKRMPAIKNGTAGLDIEPLVRRFLEGLKYEAVVDKYDYDFASVNVNLGLLTWEPDHLEANLEKILIDIENQRSTKLRKGSLITKVSIVSEHIKEKFKVDFMKYFPQNSIAAATE